jgi:hypothetical protein
LQECHCDISEWAHGQQSDAPGIRIYDVMNYLHSVTPVDGKGGRREHSSTEPILAVDHFRRNKLSLQGPGGSFCDDDIRSTAQLNELESILGSQLNGHIPGDGGDRLNLQLRGSQSQQDCHCIIDSRICIQNDAAWKLG